MRRPRFRLSVRITATFALGALAVSAIVAFSAYFFTYHFLVKQQERTSLRQSYLNAAIVRARLRGESADIPSILDALTTGSSASTVINHDGRWFSSSLAISRDAIPRAVRTTALSGRVVRSWATIGGNPRIVVGVPLPAVRSTFFEVFDESSLARTLSVLRAVLVSAAAATTGGGALLGWWASRRLTAPLRAVAQAARRLAAGELETRLPAEADADLAGLVESFNTMVDTLRRRIERDARLAADVSHELRSPLTTLSTSLSVLRTRREELSEPGRNALDLLTVELGRFERLVDDLLEISRADAHTPLEQEPVRVAELVRNLLARAEYHDIPSDIDDAAAEVFVLGDKRRLEQVLRNLLDNAATYAGGATMVRVRRDAPGVVIAVDDTGPGVAADERERIFDRFTRGGSARRRGSRGGTGLGLAIVAEHVRAHGGRVWVTDNPDGPGARFLVSLPVAQP